MGTYAIGSDSPRWWWPSAAAGAAGAAAIAAILVLPASASRAPGGTTPEAPAATPAPGSSSIDPTSEQPCYAVRVPRGATLEHIPRCGQRSVVGPWSGDVRRPDLDVSP